MAMNRFPLEKFATVELNQVAFPKTGMVVSQTPLGAEFTESAPCENGMWVSADKANGVIKSVATVADSPVGIVYTSEKEYDPYHYGLKTFGRKVAGDYPRVGILGLGDTITSNCLQYDDSEFQAVTVGDNQKTSEQVLIEALEKDLTVPANTLYVALVANSPVPKITKVKPGSGTYAKITKYYTVPNGEKGVKYQIVHL